ncbi:cytochrome P450 2J4-like [Ambystoma mexicanum]|uniref:cytochrome P450 2J4-like n=1 Tax=Ambystoma mexicanum TaxID=8296 RepID=UPI0037E769A2
MPIKKEEVGLRVLDHDSAIQTDIDDGLGNEVEKALAGEMLPPIGILIFTLLLPLLVALVLKLRRAGRHLPPGPCPLPLIGNLWTLKFQLHHETLAQLAETYGTIYTVWLGKTPVVVLNGFQAVKEAFICHSEELSDRPASPLLRAVMGNKGIIFSNGHVWRQQQRFGLMTLRKLGLGTKGLEVRIQDEANHLLQYLREEKGHPLEPACRLANSMANVICAVTFGHRFSTEDVVFRQLITTVDLLMSTRQKTCSRVYDLFPWLMRHLPGPHQQMFHDWQVLRTFIVQEIRNHQRNVTDEPQDLIDFYLEQISATREDTTSTYDEENLIEVVADIFIAGTEAPTTTLHWALLYMMMYPDIQENVQKELDAIVGRTQAIQYEDRKRLPYTNTVIHEIQRYANIVPIGPMRQCTTKITLQNMPIDKATVFVSGSSWRGWSSSSSSTICCGPSISGHRRE